MKTLNIKLAVILSVLSSTSFAAETEPLLLDAACKYICVYKIQECGDACWDTEHPMPIYYDLKGVTREQIDTYNNNFQINKSCIGKANDATKLFGDKATYSSTKGPECLYFKH